MSKMHQSRNADRAVQDKKHDDRVFAHQEGFEAFTPWFGWGLAPAAWALHQGVGYAMVVWLCRIGTRWPYDALTAFAVCLCGVGIAAAVHALRRSRHIRPERSASRMRMMALVGLMLSVTALGGITVEYLPTFWIDTCSGIR
jgi:hypothetical protein